MNGKMKDIHIQEHYNAITGELSCLSVWTDHNAVEVLFSVEGIAKVMECADKNEYLIDIDPRYDPDWVQEEIIAALKCAPSDDG